MKRQMADYIKLSGSFVDVGLSVFRTEEDGRKIVYSPSLNIVGYGKTTEEADSDFDFCLKEFISRAVQEGYLDREMKKLGWMKNSRESENYLLSPSLLEILPKDEIFQDIFNNCAYDKSNRLLSYCL